MLYNGNGINMNKEEESKYYKLSSDNGHVKSMFKYAV